MGVIYGRQPAAGKNVLEECDENSKTADQEDNRPMVAFNVYWPIGRNCDIGANRQYRLRQHRRVFQIKELLLD